jgi:hypothetical protein
MTAAVDGFRTLVLVGKPGCLCGSFPQLELSDRAFEVGAQRGQALKDGRVFQQVFHPQRAVMAKLQA